MGHAAAGEEHCGSILPPNTFVGDAVEVTAAACGIRDISLDRPTDCSPAAAQKDRAGLEEWASWARRGRGKDRGKAWHVEAGERGAQRPERARGVRPSAGAVVFHTSVW